MREVTIRVKIEEETEIGYLRALADILELIANNGYSAELVPDAKTNLPGHVPGCRGLDVDTRTRGGITD